jgi:tyrosyl-tRNA synthetase
MDMTRVEFLWSSEEINKAPEQYWTLVIDIARAFNLTRVKRCSQIMGRAAGDEMPSAQILYPCMQCADIFYLKADICQLGLDQRKVNMLARDYCNVIKRKLKPVILSHRMHHHHHHHCHCHCCCCCVSAKVSHRADSLG